MLNKLIEFVLAQRVFVLVMTGALCLFGYRAVTDIPIEAFPDVQDVQVQIVTLNPGQAPEEVERAITLPIERAMNSVPKQTQLRSVTLNGLSVVTLTFADHTDDYFARQQVLEKLQEVNLPPGIQPTLAPLSTAVGEIFRYVVRAPASMSENDVRSLQDWVISNKLRMVPGVADVVSFGGTVKEYQVRVDPDRLKRFGVTLDQVSQALADNSANVGGSFFKRGDESLVIRSIGIVRSLEDIGHIVVQANDGKTVLVQDVAQVEIGHKPTSGIVAYDKANSVVEGIVLMTKGANAAKVISDVRHRVDSINAKLPKGVRLEVIYDRTDLIKKTVHTVTENLLTGALLVIAILILFLRNWRAALIVATVIPLALLFAFILLDAKGIPANLISLGAVDFGIIIDGAVVLVEALMVRLAEQALTGSNQTTNWRTGQSVLKETVTEMGHPILFAKAIIITAFLPIFTFQRVEGKIFTPVALTLSFAILGAVILTVTWIPSLLDWAMRSGSMAEKHSPWLIKLQDRYRRMLRALHLKRHVLLLASGSALTLTLLLSPLLGSEFLPKLDEGNIWLTITLPPSSAIETTQSVEQRVRQILLSYPEVAHVISQVGRPDDATDPKGSNNIEILADLKPTDTWRFDSKDELVESMSKRLHALPGVPTNFSQVIEDNVEESLSGVKGEIAIKIFGPDLAVLAQKAREVAQVVKNIPGATDVGTTEIGGQSELDIQLDRDKIARLGLNVAAINSAVQAGLAGLPVNTFYDGDQRYDLSVRLDKPFRSSADSIGALPIALPDNKGVITLAEIARIEQTQGASMINREEGSRIASVKANLIGRDQGSFVAEAQQEVADKVKLPPGYRLTWGGQFENQQRAVKRLSVIVPVTALLIFSLLFWTFRSVRRALVVLGIVPFSVIGGVIGLGLEGLHFSVSAAVGFIAVAGISVQNGVIMIEQILEYLDEGMTLLKASVEGAISRLRPILMTALMAGLGLLPAALSHGIGSETQRPFAVVIVGGIVSATFFTLTLLPIVFSMVEQRHQKPVEGSES